MKTLKKSGALGVIAILMASAAAAQYAHDPLKSGFENPPNQARPLVWWHWMNGNITEEGIKLDLDWMHRIGLGGFQNFDAAFSTPQVVSKRLVYMTPEWKHAFVYATKLADQYGMEEAIAGSPGWSESGGPWVPPSHGMKKYVWSETQIDGGKPFTGKLTHPPAVTGPFQGVELHASSNSAHPEVPQFYGDAAVVAFRTNPRSEDADPSKAKITASGGALDPSMLSDGDLEKTTPLAVPAPGESAWVQFEFPQPQTIRAITFATKDPNWTETLVTKIAAPEKMLEASDDGEHFRPVMALPAGRAPEHTLSFAPVTAKYFRVSFKRVPAPPVPAWASGMDPVSFGVKQVPPPTDYQIAELVLHSEPRVNRFEEKAAFATDNDLYAYPTPASSPSDAISKSAVIDLTSRMKPDGSLDWTPPPGHWTLLRIGYSLLGTTNHPATPEATGLEVDKLDHRYVKDYFEKYLDSYKDTVGADWMGKRGIQYVINDSWEARSQNWTDDMLTQFRRLRGYDPTPWLPVLAGHVVESSEASDRFLWDFRKTIADLIANEHYGQLEETLHERGMKHYGESHESGRAFVADGMEVKKFNEVPMGAMWVQTPGVNKEQFAYNADDRESASVAHIYGQNLAAAESMTAAAAAWAWSPSTLKPTTDQEFLNGINRIVIHESAHQPLVDRVPGLTLGPFGQWFNRNETWAEMAKPWIDYLARCSYLLQQGRYAADIVYFYGEDSNLTAIFGRKAPAIPAGYAFDYINADALIHELQVSGGELITRSGMRYRVLALDPYSVHMSLPVLRAILQMVNEGATVAGPKPVDDPSLADDQNEFRRLTQQLFGDGAGVHHVGNGVVYAGQKLSDVMVALHLAPDFDQSRQEDGTGLQFLHRKLTDGDVYFVDNRSDQAETVNATFRVAGKAPELWRAEDGASEPASFNVAGGRTTVPLHLEPWGTVFVVFRQPTSLHSHVQPTVRETEMATIEGPWNVAFQPGRGAPSSIVLNHLASWTENSDPGVKYFSGIGTYKHALQAPASWFRPGSRLWIDLGDVKNLAEVELNGKSLGEVWHAPYRVQVTGVMKPGSNLLTVKVANAWVNRLIGDEQPGAAKITFTDVKPYRANSPLLASGLLGPVTVIRASHQ